MKRFIKPWWQGLLDLVIPPHCSICGCLLAPGGKKGICPACLMRVTYLGESQCFVCGRELHGPPGSVHRCSSCLGQPPSYIRAKSIIRYAPPVTDLLFRLKYHADTTVVPALRELITGYDFSPFMAGDLVLPVPLFRRRLQDRGLNQSLILARIFFPELSTRIAPDLLSRIRWTAPQTGLTGAARRQNLRGAFQVKDARLVSGKSLILVDDVFTTGTTVAECSRVLRQAGCREVAVVTLARVVLDD